jgi:ribosomal protein S18 acetylase RimI-like enzyme
VLILGPARLDAALGLADDFFGRTSGYSIIVDAEVVGAAVEDELLARGWRLAEEEPALVLSPLGAAPPVRADLAIHPVVDAAGFADFLRVSETPSIVLPSLAAGLDPAVALLVGYVDGRAVATARLVCLGLIAEITGIVTVPPARRRGYGTALTWAAIAAARQGGARRRR